MEVIRLRLREYFSLERKLRQLKNLEEQFFQMYDSSLFIQL